MVIELNIENLRKKQMLEFCRSALNDYNNLFGNEEINLINSFLQNKEEDTNKLLSISKKIWDYELASGKYKVVSWNKYAHVKENQDIIFATLCTIDNMVSFCDMQEGIEYEINFESLIGALNKDGATLIEDISKQNKYTIGIINNKVINSYNGATKIITPKQLLNSDDNNYKSKHNELILNAQLIKKIGIIDLLNQKEKYR